MNIVWLVPIIILLIVQFDDIRNSPKYYYFLILTGFLIAAMPDNLLLVKGVPIAEDFFKIKYVLSLIMIFSGCVFWWKRIPAQ